MASEPAQAPEAQAAFDAGVSELVATQFPEAEPPAPPETAQDSTPPEQPQTTEPPASGEQPAPQAATEPTFKFRGKEWTLQQLTENGMLEDALATYGKYSVLQDKYNSVLEQQRQAQAPTPQPGQSAPTLDRAKMRELFGPAVMQAVSAGMIEKDYVEQFPDMAVQEVAHAKLLYDVAREVRELKQVASAVTQNAQVSAVRQYHDSLQALMYDIGASDGELFAPLQDEGVRNNFLQYVTQTYNPEMNRVNRDFLRAAWVGAQQPVILQAIQNAQQRAQVPVATRNASGGAEGTRPGRLPEQQAPDWGDIVPKRMWA